MPRFGSALASLVFMVCWRGVRRGRRFLKLDYSLVGLGDLDDDLDDLVKSAFFQE